ncbi:uncharacterized protein LOC118769441 isoform X3 [Megalops cyprinoides]|uniref:uncharacterized protein LOC118769441 isoform X3 n=1 Tax=Megalops cyprinoides TaxID=118141 RepID=UPI001865152F|nr:uncharacterized protein LOC118769441 isoform X3 [Megalops cyprinoides]
MASPGFDIGRNQPQHQHQQSESAPEPAFQEAQKWIEAVTGRRFGDKDFRGGLENGILLCELLSSIKPGLVKKINRLPTPIAGLDNLTLFLRGCEELGLKGSQLFDPGDLQDTSVRANLKGSDCSRKLKNVLITIYWLGKAANSCTSYNGPTLDLKEFEGLLSQMRKESEDTESPKRNIRDSGYIDCWDTERSESLSPPRHGRDDSFDSLDSFGSRSQQTPSPDVVIRASSDGRGSDSETDAPHRKLPDVRKDDMLARRTSYSEPRSAMPFNQYLPNKSNQSAYVPTPLRKKRAEREEGRSSWSTATSPIGGDRPFSHPETIQEEGSVQEEEEEEEGRVPCKRPAGPQREAGPGPRVSGPGRQKTVTWGGESREAAPPAWEGKEEQEARRLRKLEKAGIRVLPAAVRYSSLRPATGEEQEKQEAPPPVPDIILRRDNDFLKPQPEQAWDSGEEDEEEEGEGGGGGERRVPDVQRDDLASRRARMSRLAPRVQQQFLPATCSSKDRERWEGIRRASQQAALERLQQQGALSESEPTTPETPSIITRKDNPFLWPRQQKQEDEEEEGGQGGGPQAVPNVQKDDLARRRAQSGPLTNKDPLQAFVQASITQSDMEKWQRLKINTEPSESEAPPPEVPDIVVRKENPSLRPQEDRGEEEEEEGGQGGGLQAVPNVQKDDLARRRAQSGPLPNKDPRQAFVQASITQSDMEKWQRLKMTTEPSEVPQAPLCQACLEKGSMPPAIQAETAALDDLANRRARANRRAAGNRQRFVHFGPVTEIDQKCWERLSIARPGEEEEEQGAGPGNEAQTLRRLLSAAAVATPTIGLGSQLTERVASVALGDTAPAYPLSEDSASDGATAAELAQREHEALDERLAQYREREEEEEEEEDEGDGKLPDLEKDDMLARRTGAFQKSSGGPSFNKFLPLPGSKLQPQKDGLPDSPKAKKEDLPESPKMKTEPSLDGQKPKGEVTPSSPKANPELSSARADLHHQEPEETAATSPHSGADVPAVVRATALRQSSCDDYDDDGDYNEEERLPDLEKDDMHARRTGAFQKKLGGAAPNFNLFLPVPGSVKYKAPPISSQSSPSVRPVEQEKPSARQSSSSSLSCSAELYRAPMATATATTSITVTTPGTATPKDSPETARKSPRMMDREEVCRGRNTASPTADAGRDDMWTRRALSPRRATSSPTHFLPVPASQQARAGKAETEGDKPRRRPSWLDDDLPPIFSHRAASVSDEPESVSMIDMRCEEEAILQPHSQARHELMHNQYNKLKEEEDQWQDDLARWKNRRRSASQDLIKKEEERKMMEKLMSGDGSQSQRRKSIKTYKEIVEDKERREQELHEAYRSARSPEEAASILQRYALRFTISEAVLERLQLPKLLDRSVSADPSAPPAGPSPAASSTSTSTSQTPDSSPMKYLRQQSAPAPKFTATVETTLTGVAQTQPHQTQPRSHTQTQPPVPIQPPARSPEHSPTRTVPSKAVPLLTPKPYIQPKASQAGLKTLKSDGMVRVNGETGEAFSRPESGADRVGGASPVRSSLPALPRSPLRAPGSPRKEPPGAKTPTAHPPPAPELAPARDVLQDTSKAQAPPADPAQDTAPSRPTSLPTELQREGGVCEEAGPRSAAQRQRGEGGESTAAPSAWKEDKQDEGQAGSGVAAMATEQKFGVKTTVLLELTPKHEQQTTELSSSANLSKSLDSAQRDRDGPDSGHPAESRTEPPRPSSEAPCGSPVLEDLEKESLTITAPVLNLAKRIDHWSWDPEEERKRQERWQQEQERVLQVKYQQEQEKLKKEWERAQKEVEEEERKYHEEERRILEETVAPLTPRSSALPSPSRGDLPPSADPEDTIVRSLADWERKQELLERQARGEEVKLRDNWCVCNEAMEQKTAVKTDDSEQVAESLHLQSPSQKEANTQAQQNGQRPPVDQGQAAVPELQFIQASPWSSKQPQSPQQQQEEVWKKTASLDRNWTSQQTQPGGVKRSGSCENVGTSPSKSSACPSSMQPQSPNRSVSGKKLCSSCGHPLGKGAAMIIETLSLYFHIQCFKCGICKGQLGDTSTGTDVRIRNGLLNCHQCYIRSRGNPAPTPDEHAAKHTPSLRSHAPVQAVEHALTQTQT